MYHRREREREGERERGREREGERERERERREISCIQSIIVKVCDYYNSLVARQSEKLGLNFPYF